MSPRSLLGMACFIVMVPAAPAAELPADAARADALVQRLAQAVAKVNDYRAVLTKVQRIRGELRPAETIVLKHRRDPACRYLRWLEGPHEGREILHCAGRNGDEMLVHEGGLLGLITLSLDPHGRRAKKDDLRPITETGIYSLASFAQADREHHASSGDTRVEIAPRIVQGQASTCIGSPGGTSLTPVYAAGRREVCVHDEFGLPTEVRIWNDAGDLMEHYTFRDYVLNPGLADADFDPDNDDYRF